MRKISLLASLFLAFNLFAKAETCFVQMDDSLNKNTTILSVTKHSEEKYEVTDLYNDIHATDGWVEFVYVIDNKVSGDAGVPGDLPMDLFLKRYKMRDDSQLTWTILNEHCDELQNAIIYYMVIEWFYFG